MESSPPGHTAVTSYPISWQTPSRYATTSSTRLFSSGLSLHLYKDDQRLISYFDRSEMENLPPSHAPFPVVQMHTSSDNTIPANSISRKQRGSPPPTALSHGINPTELAAAPSRRRNPRNGGHLASNASTSSIQLHEGGGARLEGGPSEEGQPPGELSTESLNDDPPVYRMY